VQKTHVDRIRHLVIQLLSGEEKRTAVAHNRAIWHSSGILSTQQSHIAQ
jgi:hypothetical protein